MNFADWKQRYCYPIALIPTVGREIVIRALPVLVLAVGVGLLARHGFSLVSVLVLAIGSLGWSAGTLRKDRTATVREFLYRARVAADNAKGRMRSKLVSAVRLRMELNK